MSPHTATMPRLARDGQAPRRKSAVISADGRYRYVLRRWWGGKETIDKPILWVMLNPSTADAEVDDPTIRRCIAFSRSWGYDGMLVGNKYAFRSTDPYALKSLRLAEATGPDNDMWLRRMASVSDRIVLAWGNHGGQLVPGALTHTLHDLWCLGRNRDGSPKHPLYLRYNLPLQPWRS